MLNHRHPIVEGLLIAQLAHPIHVAEKMLKNCRVAKNATLCWKAP